MLIILHFPFTLFDNVNLREIFEHSLPHWLCKKPFSISDFPRFKSVCFHGFPDDGKCLCLHKADGLRIKYVHSNRIFDMHILYFTIDFKPPCVLQHYIQMTQEFTWVHVIFCVALHDSDGTCMPCEAHIVTKENILSCLDITEQKSYIPAHLTAAPWS